MESKLFSSATATLSTSTTIITARLHKIHSFRTAPNQTTLIPSSSRHLFISISSSLTSNLSLGSSSPILSRPDPFSIWASSSSSEGETDGEETLVLDVRGMMCDGCAASVKRMLESQSQVSSANVNLSSETATVLPVPEAKVSENWQLQLGEILAKHLTNCGFESKIRAHQ